MANLTGTPTYQNFVRRLETTDPRHPDTWNPNYQNLINNDVFLKQFADEVAAARNGGANLAARFTQLDNNLQQAAQDAVDNATLATRQGGVVTIINRGVVSGCAVTVSVGATRNLNIAGGACFANGRAYSVAAGTNVASVPINTGTSAAQAHAYLQPAAGGVWNLSVTPLAAAIPANGIPLYDLTIPANNTDATDPDLSEVTITDVRRMEPLFPVALENAPFISVPLSPSMAGDYILDFDVVSAVGAPAKDTDAVVYSRANNGYTLRFAAAADNVVLRWQASQL